MPMPLAMWGHVAIWLAAYTAVGAVLNLAAFLSRARRLVRGVEPPVAVPPAWVSATLRDGMRIEWGRAAWWYASALAMFVPGLAHLLRGRPGAALLFAAVTASLVGLVNSAVPDAGWSVVAWAWMMSCYWAGLRAWRNPGPWSGMEAVLGEARLLRGNAELAVRCPRCLGPTLDGRLCSGCIRRISPHPAVGQQAEVGGHLEDERLITVGSPLGDATSWAPESFRAATTWEADHEISGRAWRDPDRSDWIWRERTLELERWGRTHRVVQTLLHQVAPDGRLVSRWTVASAEERPG